ncbi:MAG: ATP-grasp domain-containing protein [Vicinamibacterales bacterium]
MKRILILSHTTGYQLRAFNDAAEALGIELVFATDRCHALDDPWQDRAIAVRFYDVDGSVAAIVEAVQERRVDGLIAVGDRQVLLAARAAAALGLPWHSTAGAVASTDKRRSREALAAAGLPSPAFCVFPVTSPHPAPRTRTPPVTSPLPAPRPPFPLVLKPVGLSGSRGVIRVDDDAGLAAAIERIQALLARPQIRAARAGLEDEILVEAYIDGREFAVEGVMSAGELRVFAIFDKPDPLEGPFFEETIYVTPSREPAAIQARIIDHVARAAVVLGLRHGPIHAECRVTSAEEVVVLEVAGRPIGGLCSRVLTFVGAKSAEGANGAGGAGAKGANCAEGADANETDGAEGAGAGTGGSARVSLESVLLEHALGRALDEWTLAPGAAAVMMIPIPARGLYKGVAGDDEARAVSGVTDVRITAKVGQLLEPLPEAGSYLGFIFARGGAPAAAEASVRAAHAKLRFSIAREVAVRGTGDQGRGGAERGGGERGARDAERGTRDAGTENRKPVTGNR